MTDKNRQAEKGSKGALCSVDTGFFILGSCFLGVLLSHCFDLGLSKTVGSPTDIISEPVNMLKLIVLTMLVPGCYIGSAGGLFKSPSLLAIGMLTSHIILTGFVSFALIILMWTVKGGHAEPALCSSEVAWYARNVWCMPWMMFVLVLLIILLFSCFCYSVVEHWQRVNDAVLLGLNAELCHRHRDSTKCQQPTIVTINTPKVPINTHLY